MDVVYSRVFSIHGFARIIASLSRGIFLRLGIAIRSLCIVCILLSEVVVLNGTKQTLNKGCCSLKFGIILFRICRNMHCGGRVQMRKNHRKELKRERRKRAYVANQDTRHYDIEAAIIYSSVSTSNF